MRLDTILCSWSCSCPCPISLMGHVHPQPFCRFWCLFFVIHSDRTLNLRAVWRFWEDCAILVPIVHSASGTRVFSLSSNGEKVVKFFCCPPQGSLTYRECCRRSRLAPHVFDRRAVRSGTPSSFSSILRVEHSSASDAGQEIIVLKTICRISTMT